jgi:hypothetical protein
VTLLGAILLGALLGLLLGIGIGALRSRRDR